MARYYCLDATGQFIRVDFPGKIEGQIVNLDSPLFEAIGANTPRYVPNMAVLDGMKLNLCEAKNIYVTGRLKTLRLKATFSTKAKLTLPDWGNPDITPFPIEWIPPQGMVLAFCVEMQPNGGGVSLQRLYLFAASATNIKETYKLPLPNLYDDCKICLPYEITVKHPTVLDCFAYGLDILRNSEWNSHLIKDAGEFEPSQNLFRFKPNGEGFETLEPNTKDWKTLCKSVGTAMLEYVQI